MARDEKLMIRLITAVKEDFQKYSDELGMTMSALGSYVIGDWIRAQKRKEQLEEASHLAMVEHGKQLIAEEQKRMEEQQNRP